MKLFKKLLASAAIIFAGSLAHAAPSYFQNPTPSTTTGVASAWLVGTYEIRRSSNDPFVVVRFSTAGVHFSSGTVTISTNVSGIFSEIRQSTTSLGLLGSNTNYVPIAGGIMTGNLEISGAGATFDILTGTVTAGGLRFSSATMNPGGFFDGSKSTGSFNGLRVSTVIINTGGGIVFADGTRQNTASTGGGGGTVGNSTYTKTLTFPGYVHISTIGLQGLAGAYDGTGQSTWGVVGISASFVQGSTVAMSSIQLVVSTGGLSGLPVTNMFPRVDIPTATSTSYSSYSTFVSTPGWNLNSGSFVGVQVSTGPESGRLPRGLKVDLYLWEPPFPR